jgi:hypothetical protein
MWIIWKESVLFLLSIPYKGILQQHPKYLLSQYVIQLQSCPVLSVVLRKVLTIHIVRYSVDSVCVHSNSRCEKCDGGTVHCRCFKSTTQRRDLVRWSGGEACTQIKQTATKKYVHCILMWICLINRDTSWQSYRHLWADCLDNVGSLTSHNPIGLHSLLQG